ncbi:MAG: DUF4421 family protein [Bacteroidetes bacterium]|nr:DUF4421 family protein [Bacteroidota bacterium]
MSDLRTNIIGLNVQYLFNSERYSYKASFLQNEFQKRSAGSHYWIRKLLDARNGGLTPLTGRIH